MANDAQKFIDCLKDAGQLLEDYPSVDRTGTDHNISPPALKNFDLTLFEEWSKFSEQEVSQKQPVRIIQHLSCTGGTIICKCIAGMPNVALLSEVNPLSQLHVSYKPKFAPTDLTYLALQGKLPLFDDLSRKIFKADIATISKHVQELGQYLVLREHSHSDFLVGDSSGEISIIKKLLKDDYPLLCILTVRHPVDSYLSLISNKGWTHFTPTTFDEYCRRYLLFIEHNKDVPVYKYEDFLADPETELKLLCKTLNLPFNADFLDVFDLNTMSGDSGRASNVISARDRRDLDDGFRAELEESVNYKQLCNILKYEPLIE